MGKYFKFKMHISGHKARPNKFNRIIITYTTFSDNNAFNFLKNSFIEIKFTYQIIHPFKVCNSMDFSILNFIENIKSSIFKCMILWH